MIKGIGIDIVEIKRIEKALKTTPLLERFFTKAEALELTGKLIHVHAAGKFAAKEAVVKALGTGFSGFKWTDVEIIKAPSGKPSVKLKGRALDTARKKGIDKIHVSISHSREYAAAQAIAVKTSGEV